MSGARLNPTLFDKLVSDLDFGGLTDGSDSASTPDPDQTASRFYIIPKIERFNETALRNTVRRELNWVLNTTNLSASVNLDAYPAVRTSVLNYGVGDLAGRLMTSRMIKDRAREIRDAIRAFEPRMDPGRIEVTSTTSNERENAVTYVISGDVTSAVKAMPVEFKTDIELDTANVVIRE